MAVLHLFLLIVCANGTPLILARVLGWRLPWPVDRGHRLSDGQPLFGSHKTWPGIAIALSSTSLLSQFLGLEAGFGLTLALAAMIGDLFSSFCKRRSGLPDGQVLLILDAVPEALLPGLFGRWYLAMEWLELGLVLLGFLALDAFLVRWRRGRRWRPPVQ